MAEPPHGEGQELRTLEERVDVLESRVDSLEAEARHRTDMAVTAARDARAAQEAHKKNIELLNALRQTQAEHTQILAEHTRRFDAIERRLGTIDGRLDGHDERLDRIDGKLGQLTVGMHTIEGLLRRLVNE